MITGASGVRGRPARLLSGGQLGRTPHVQSSYNPAGKDRLPGFVQVTLLPVTSRLAASDAQQGTADTKSAARLSRGRARVPGRAATSRGRRRRRATPRLPLTPMSCRLIRRVRTTRQAPRRRRRPAQRFIALTCRAAVSNSPPACAPGVEKDRCATVNVPGSSRCARVTVQDGQIVRTEVYLSSDGALEAVGVAGRRCQRRTSSAFDVQRKFVMKRRGLRDEACDLSVRGAGARRPRPRSGERLTRCRV